jgi:hypothetical protein
VLRTFLAHELLDFLGIGHREELGDDRVALHLLDRLEFDRQASGVHEFLMMTTIGWLVVD